jgi:S1-C subfamily serine protease
LAGWAGLASQGTVVVEASARGETRTGSGFFLDRQGLVATALHTVEGARRIRVVIPGRFAASDARLLAATSAWDLAVLEVRWPAEVPYPGLTLDAGAPLPPGAEIALTGYGALGEGLTSVPLTLRGIVSGTLEHQGAFSYILDLGVREGFSGSPVFRTDTGAVVAVLTRALASPGSGSSAAATPAAALQKLLEEIGRPSLCRPASSIGP